MLETDSASVHNLFTVSTDPSEELNGLLYECRQLCKRPWNAEVKHIYQEANGVADRIAKWVLGQSVGYHFLDWLSFS